MYFFWQIDKESYTIINLVYAFLLNFIIVSCWILFKFMKSQHYMNSSWSLNTSRVECNA